MFVFAGATRSSDSPLRSYTAAEMHTQALFWAALLKLDSRIVASLTQVTPASLSNVRRVWLAQRCASTPGADEAVIVGNRAVAESEGESVAMLTQGLQSEFLLRRMRAYECKGASFGGERLLIHHSSRRRGSEVIARH